MTKIGENSLDFYADERWQEVKKASAEHSFFHWDLEFLDIFYGEDGKRSENPGFDAVVGNPPWDILKPDVEEFFSIFYDLEHSEKFRQLTKMKKNEFVRDKLKNEEIRKQWEKYNENFKKQSQYFVNAYSFQISIINGKKQSSDINLYKLFLERSHQIVVLDGLCGMVIPSGVYSDLGTRGLRKMLFENTRIKSLYSFINKKGIFEGVHRQFKFCILVFRQGGATKKFLASFYLEDIVKLKTLNHDAFEFDLDLIQSSSPTALSIIECKNKTESGIVKKLYQNPTLSSNEWDLQARSEFHMTNDSGLFHTTKVGLPLYEGKMIYQFSNTLSQPTYYISKEKGDAHLHEKERRRIKKKTTNLIQPQLDYQHYRLVWRDVTNAVDRRTLISTIVPPNVFLGNTLSYILPIVFDGAKYVRSISDEETAYLCGMLNSFPVDFILRHRVNLHVSIFHMMELPIPKFDERNDFHKIICTNTAKLICTSSHFDGLKNRVNIEDGETDAKKRLQLQAQINATSCKIYGVGRDELKFILEYFRVEDDQLKEKVLNEFDLIRPYA